MPWVQRSLFRTKEKKGTPEMRCLRCYLADWAFSTNTRFCSFQKDCGLYLMQMGTLDWLFYMCDLHSAYTFVKKTYEKVSNDENGDDDSSSTNDDDDDNTSQGGGRRGRGRGGGRGGGGRLNRRVTWRKFKSLRTRVHYLHMFLGMKAQRCKHSLSAWVAHLST